MYGLGTPEDLNFFIQDFKKKINNIYNAKKIHQINHIKLYNLLVKIFIKYGSSLKIAKKVSNYLTQADLSGQNSHGAARAPLYLEKINDKKLFPNSKLKIFNENRNIVQIDGNWGFGQVVAE